jgi:hypothetical protein
MFRAGAALVPRSAGVLLLADEQAVGAAEADVRRALS